jgi:hypothetical protein
MKKKELIAKNKKLLEERELLGSALKILAETLGKSGQKSKTLKEMYLGILDVKDGLEKRIASLETENLELKKEVQISKDLLEATWYKEASKDTPKENSEENSKEDSELLQKIKKEIQELFNTKESFENALRDIYHKAQDSLGITQR